MHAYIFDISAPLVVMLAIQVISVLYYLPQIGADVSTALALGPRHSIRGGYDLLRGSKLTPSAFNHIAVWILLLAYGVALDMLLTSQHPANKLALTLCISCMVLSMVIYILVFSLRILIVYRLRRYKAMIDGVVLESLRDVVFE